MVVTLIGYRGCGKTTVARALSGKLAWEHVDADEEVERIAGRSIRTIFDESGEAEFRRRERETIAELLTRDRIVISAGGGAVMNLQTREEMQAAGPVVWLTANVETLWSRIQQDVATAEQRPDLTAAGGRAEIETLLAERTPIYEQCASVVVATDGASTESIVERILDNIGGDISQGHHSA